MNEHVIIYIQAYNAERTLKRAIKSVLHQTYGSFILYVLDNGSLDATRTIIMNYAEKDHRIVPILRDMNHSLDVDTTLPLFSFVEQITRQYDGSCYFACLDADDEYTPDFLEKMLIFMREYELEVAACGNDFIDAQTNKTLGVRKLEENLVLDGDGFGRHFPQYYMFMRTVWGKIYSLSVLTKSGQCDEKRVSYGLDTLFTMGAFRNADRVGILAESLHKYSVSPKSASYQFDSKRIDSDQILFDTALDFLKIKCGIVSQENLNFLHLVYFYAIRDTIEVLHKSEINITDQLLKLREIFQSPHTRGLIQWPGATAIVNGLLRETAVWLLSQEEVRTVVELETVADILVAMEMYPSGINDWQNSRMFLLFTKIKDKLAGKGHSGSQELINNIDAEIVSVTANSSLLVGLDVGILSYFSDIVYSILEHDETRALVQLEEMIEQEDIPDEYIEDFLALGLKLSTRLEYTGDFIYLKKLQISLLIDLLRIDEARTELADWDEILPDDIDFEEFRTRLMQ